MSKKNWDLNEYGTYYSYHINELYYGDDYPKYHVLRNPDGDGWVIGQFYTFVGEYVPLEEDDEERLIFSTEKEAMDYADKELEKI